MSTHPWSGLCGHSHSFLGCTLRIDAAHKGPKCPSLRACVDIPLESMWALRMKRTSTLAGQIHVVQAPPMAKWEWPLWIFPGLSGHLQFVRTLLHIGLCSLFPLKTYKDVPIMLTPHTQMCTILLRLKKHITYASVAVLVNLKPPEKRCKLSFLFSPLWLNHFIDVLTD